MSDFNFVPSRIGDRDCDGNWEGLPTTDWRYPIYPWTGDLEYPVDACPLRRHDFVQVTDLRSANVSSLNAKASY